MQGLYIWYMFLGGMNVEYSAVVHKVLLHLLAKGVWNVKDWRWRDRYKNVIASFYFRLFYQLDFKLEQ